VTTTQRHASVVQLIPEKEAEYRQLHTAVWPEVLNAIAAAGIRNYSIFLRDGMLFSYLEYAGTDYDADMAALANDPATRKWWLLTDPCQNPVASAEPGDWWAPAVEVFHTAGDQNGSPAL
jgi:L-rhamnose mutarotase